MHPLLQVRTLNLHLLERHDLRLTYGGVAKAHEVSFPAAKLSCHACWRLSSYFGV